MRDHNKLRAVELADEAVLLIYWANRKFPKEEIYGFDSQMRKAAVLVPSNIKTNSLQPFDRLRAMSLVEWPSV